MTNASLGTLKSQVARLIKENTRLQVEVGTLRGQLTEAQDDHRTFVNQVLSGSPECWVDETDPATVVALDYVASLEGQGGSMNGHRENCGCWS